MPDNLGAGPWDGLKANHSTLVFLIFVMTERYGCYEE